MSVLVKPDGYHCLRCGGKLVRPSPNQYEGMTPTLVDLLALHDCYRRETPLPAPMPPRSRDMTYIPVKKRVGIRLVRRNHHKEGP